MAWWWLVYWVSTLILTEVMRPKPNFEDAAAANSDEVNMPTASATKTIRVVWGKCRLRDLNLMWYGDYLAAPIRKKAGKGGFLGMGHTIWQTVGYRYHWGQQLGLAHGPLTLHRIWAEERELWSGTASTDQTIIVNKDDMYGGEDSGGGLVAKIAFYCGSQTQIQDPYLTARLGEIPAYRGLAHLVWMGPSAAPIPYQFDAWKYVKASDDPHEVAWVKILNTITLYATSGYIGTGPTPRPLTVEVSRYPAQLNAAESKIGDDCNPIELIFECLTTDPNGPDGWGMGLSDSMIDKPTFIAAAHKCFTESFGVSLSWGDQTPIEDVIKSVCKTIDAVCFRDFRSGKWSIKLLRDDYVAANLPVFNEDNILELTDFTQNSIDGSVNEVKVNFTDRANNYKSRPAQAQDLANMRMQNEVVSTTMAFPAIAVPALADRVANRELVAMSSSLAKANLIVNREAYAYGPGDVFALSWPSLGILNMPVRIVKSAIGLPNANQIRLSVIQDIFKLGQTAYMAGGVSSWDQPVQDPVPIVTQKLIETPYFFNPEMLPVVYSLCAARPSAACMDLFIHTRIGGETIYSLISGVADNSFTPTATLLNAYGITSYTDSTETLILTNANGLAELRYANGDDRIEGANLCFFETGEWISFGSAKDNGDGTFTLLDVWRGLLDTLPASHSAGERIWFFSNGVAQPLTGVADNQTIYVKGTPNGPRGSISPNLATAASVALASRAQKPYPPARPLVNGIAINSSSIGQATLTWRHRNKTTTTTVKRQDDVSDAAPEGLYEVQVFVGGAYKRTFTAIADTFAPDYTPALRNADSSDGSLPVVFKAKQYTASFSSAYHETKPFVMTGLGMCLGMYLGGVQE